MQEPEVNMLKKGTLNKIILAVDMSDSSNLPTKSVWKMFDGMLDELKAKVDAVHILQYPKKLLLDQELVNGAKKELKQFMDRTGLVNCSELNVLPGSASLSESINVLLKYSDAKKAKMIAVVSHGRRWMVRFVMGSFAEALLSRSEIPILFLSKKNVVKSRRTLFLTDFSKPSLIAYRQFLDQFSDFKPDLIIYHALPPLYEFSGMMETYPTESRKYADQQINELVELAEKQGYSVSGIVDENVLDIPKAIGKKIKSEKVSMIAYSSIAKRYGVAFVGNVAKRLFRLENVNKWVSGPASINKLLKTGKKQKLIKHKKERLVEARA